MKDDPSLERELRQGKPKLKDAKADEAMTGIELPMCACMEDLLLALSPELTAGPALGKGVLRKFTCLDCGRVYLTNSMSDNDLCPDCKEKGRQLPETGIALER